MASQEQESVLDLSPLSRELLAEQEVVPRARVFAKYVAGLLSESAVSVYTLASNGHSSVWLPRATTGDAAIHDQAIPADSGILGSLTSDAPPILRSGAQLKREDYARFDTRRTLQAHRTPIFPPLAESSAGLARLQGNRAAVRPHEGH